MATKKTTKQPTARDERVVAVVTCPAGHVYEVTQAMVKDRRWQRCPTCDELKEKERGYEGID